MARVDDILRRAFPDRDAFTEEETAFASAVLSNASAGLQSRAVLPVRFVPVGETTEVGGHRYRCVVREWDPCPASACSGCDISRKSRWCQDLQCSVFDRRDGTNVWYVEVEDGE